MARQYQKSLKQEPGSPLAPAFLKFIKYAADAEKFILPVGGRLLNDRGLRSIDDSKPIALPFPLIALEYKYSKTFNMRPGQVPSMKRIIFCKEIGNRIALTPCPFVAGRWIPMPPLEINRVNFLDRSKCDQDGGPAIIGFRIPNIAKEEYSDEIGCFLDFIAALDCNNIGIEKVNTTSAGNRKTRRKNAINYNSYHILTIDIDKKNISNSKGNHHTGRQPREHIRRGHIRRYSDTHKIFIKSTLVNAGKGLNKIDKSYRLVNSKKSKNLTAAGDRP